MIFRKTSQSKRKNLLFFTMKKIKDSNSYYDECYLKNFNKSTKTNKNIETDSELKDQNLNKSLD